MATQNIVHTIKIPKKGFYIWVAAVLLIIAGVTIVTITMAQKRGDSNPAVQLVSTYVRESAARNWPGVMPLLSGEALQSARYAAEASASRTTPEKILSLDARTWADYGPNLTVVEATAVTTGGIKPAGQTNWQRFYFWVLTDNTGLHIIHVSETPPALDAMSPAGSVPPGLNLSVQKYLSLAAQGNMRQASAYLVGQALTATLRDPQYTDTKVQIPAGSVVGTSVIPVAKGASSEIVEASYSVFRPEVPQVNLRVLAVAVNAGGTWYISDLYLAGQSAGGH